MKEKQKGVHPYEPCQTGGLAACRRLRLFRRNLLHAPWLRQHQDHQRLSGELCPGAGHPLCAGRSEQCADVPGRHLRSGGSGACDPSGSYGYGL